MEAVGLNKAKQRGTAAEVALVAALRRLGWPHAERLALGGSKDKGDTTGHPGLVFEQKDAKVWKLAEWMRETEAERSNADADYGILVVKVPGVGYPNAEKWLTVMDYEDDYDLWSAAGKPDRRWVKMGAVGLHKGLAQMVERERHCGSTPVTVQLKRHGANGHWGLMRLDARCKLLVDAGYGGYAIMDAATSGIVKEHDDE
jgi:hypothetical protein